LGEGDDAVLVNSSGAPWTGEPVAVPLVLEPGRLAAAEVAVIGDAGPLACPAQLEVESRYRDGSVRRANAVLEPELAVGDRLRLRLRPTRERAPDAAGASERPATDKVSLSLLPHRGGAIEGLAFPELGPAPLLGTVPHGTFDAIEYTPDFYSGHVLAVDDHARKTTDLGPATIAWCHRGGVRDTVEARVETRLGLWRKRYRLYHHRARVDLVHDVDLQDARVRSLRAGFVTWLAGGWDRDTLRYVSQNGGRQPDRFALSADVRVEQSQAVSEAVSARSCLGATGGYVDVEDAERGVGVLVDTCQAALAPLLDYRALEASFFLRLQHSAAESDEVRAGFFRGRHCFRLALVGHASGTDDVPRAARALATGLSYRTRVGCGVADAG
ncbi:MAG: hypothetical protein MJE66_25620, partial [Proteobacteria bacterium]|nr:hypothetical protein [Pseudomonadota bacterium]